MPVWLSALIAEIVAEVVKQILLNLPAIVAAWHAANVSTLTDARPDPNRVDALRQEDASLVAAGKLPPAAVR